MEDTKNLPILILTLAMPFIAAFHTSLGAPWMLSSVSTLVVCALTIGAFSGVLKPAVEISDAEIKSEPLGNPQASDKKLAELLSQDQS